MDTDEILNVLALGKISPKEAKKMLAVRNIEKIKDFARLDIGRRNRIGMPEVVYASSKTYEQILAISKKILESSGFVLVSRMKIDHARTMTKFADDLGIKYNVGKNTTTMLFYNNEVNIKKYGTVGIMAAGTSDIGVAEESRLMCEAMGCNTVCSYDVGVAAMHRLLDAVKEMINHNVDAIITVAGMEGSMSTVVCSLTDIPVIGVPSSVGYGHGGSGEAALSSMLQSCATGLMVVNIDNGIGAGTAAAGIARKAHT
ncbi:MAG: hypothetical protein K8823_213 [Cenarchaeum symbiont of Oopsacas minuta]|nr:hypothetical protein [Cenarchaeum symbiont of Oopsacas minuta]